MIADLKFIKTSDLKKIIHALWDIYNSSVNIKNIYKNIIDPIKMNFDYYFLNTSVKDLLYFEILRQQDKTRTNAIGYFHQNIFQYIKGWFVPTKGWDVINDDQNIFCEIKNKHNTMNSSSQKNTIIRMLNQISKDSTFQCYIIQIISKNSQNKTWSVTLDNKKIENERIRILSIDKFYELITHDQNSFFLLINKINEILKSMFSQSHNIKHASHVKQNVIVHFQNMEDLTLLKHLYQKAFKNYLGLDQITL